MCQSRSQTQCSNLWSRNETTSVHAHIIWKWRPAQRAAAAVCWKSLTSTQLKLWRRWVFVDLPPEIRGSFVLKPRWVLEPILSYCCWTKKKEDEKWHFCNRTLLCLAVFHVAFGHLYESCWSKRHSKRKTRCLNKLLGYLWWSYMAFA